MEDTTVSFKVSFKRNTIPVCVAASTTVGELQVALERKLQIATGNQKFLSKGKMLEPQLTLAEANNSHCTTHEVHILLHDTGVVLDTTSTIRHRGCSLHKFTN